MTLVSYVIPTALSGTAVLLLTELTGAPDNKSSGIEYCQKYEKKYRRYLRQLLKSLEDIDWYMCPTIFH